MPLSVYQRGLRATWTTENPRNWTVFIGGSVVSKTGERLSLSRRTFGDTRSGSRATTARHSEGPLLWESGDRIGQTKSWRQ
jgi:hypothetical protein